MIRTTISKSSQYRSSGPTTGFNQMSKKLAHSQLQNSYAQTGPADGDQPLAERSFKPTSPITLLDLEA